MKQVILATILLVALTTTAWALPEVLNEQLGGDVEMLLPPGGNLAGWPGGSMFPNQDPDYIIINLTNNPYGDSQAFPNGYYMKYAGFNADGTRIAVSARNQVGSVSQIYEIWVMDYDVTTQMVSNFQQITSNGGVGDVAFNGMPAWSRTNPDLLLFAEIHQTTANLVKTYDFSTTSFATFYDPALDTNGYDATNPGFYAAYDDRIVLGSGYDTGDDRILMFDGTYPSMTMSSPDKNLGPASDIDGVRVTYYSTNSTYPYPAGSIFTQNGGGTWVEDPNGFGDPSTGDVPGLWAFYNGKADDQILSLRSDLGWSATGLGLYGEDGTFLSDLLGDGGTDFQWAYGNHNWEGPDGEILFRAEEYGHSGYGNNMFIALPMGEDVFVDCSWTGPSDCGGHAWGFDAFPTIQEGINRVAPLGTITIGPGVYEEQLVINAANLTLIGAGSGSDSSTNTIIRAPDTLTYFFNSGSADNYAVMVVDGVTGVTIRDLRVDGAGKGNVNYRFCGIGYWNAGGNVIDCYVDAVRDTPFSGSQHGVGIYAYNDTGGPYTIGVSGTTVDDFQKTGIALNGHGLTVTASGCTVIGRGATGTTAQNGIQIGWGAGGTVSDCSVSGIAYTGASWVASGMLFFEGTTIDVTGSCTVTGSQASILYRETQGSVDGATVTTSGVINEEGISIRDWGYAMLAGDEGQPVPASPLEESWSPEGRPLGATTTNVDISDATLTGVHEPGSYGIALWSVGDDVNSTITGCDIQDWEIGVHAYESGSTVTAVSNDNGISSNDLGFWTNAVVDQDATCNWWGDASGPTAPLNLAGTGDEIDGNIAYIPWLTAAYPMGECNGYPADNIAVDPLSVRCLSYNFPCDTVDVLFSRLDTTPVRGVSVTFELSSELALCAGLASIREGSYLSGAGGTHFEVTSLGGGLYTVDCAILGIPCGATGNGVLFTIDIKGSGGDGTGTVTVTSVTVRDCSNGPVVAFPGAPVDVTIDHTSPVAISDLAASQVKSGNDSDGTTEITLTFTAPGDAAVVEVYRAPYGDYPEYDDGTGAEPAAPVGYSPGAPWVLTSVTASGQTDEVANRDFWYYVVYTRDACGNVSLVSNKTTGTLNYHLGDVTDGSTPGTGDNLVNSVDISKLGTHYWSTLIHNDLVNYLDVGPTTDYSVDALPTTDNQVQFEDLMMFAINFGQVSLMADLSPRMMEYPDLSLVVDSRIGDIVTARVVLEGNRASVKGLHAAVDYGAGLELVSFSKGGLWIGQGGPIFLEHLDEGGVVQVDGAVLGRGLSINGSGAVCELRFRVVGTVTELPRLVSADLRDRDNGGFLRAAERKDVVESESLAQIEFAAAPNPFSGGTALHFAIPSSDRVSLRVFDVNGRLVTTLVDENLSAGHHRVVWESAGVSPGVYMAILRAGTERETRKLTLLP